MLTTESEKSMAYTFSFFKEASDYIASYLPEQPEIAIILGSSLGPFADEIENPIVIDYKDIPNFLQSTAPSHAGKLIYGTIAGKKVLCMSGRFHYYEGYDFEQLVIPIRVFRLLGIQKVILTNAVGAVNTDYEPGDIVVIKDHIKLNGASPLRGPNIEEFGKRFCDTSKMYTPELRELALTLAKDTSLKVHEGVYMYMPGPQFETPAEIRAIRILGGDVVGMSTVTEAITAAHCGMMVLCLSVVTNMAAGVLEQPLTLEEVVETGKTIAPHFSAYMKTIVEGI